MPRNGCLALTKAWVDMFDRGLAASKADHRVRADVVPRNRPYAEGHLLSAHRTLGRDMPPRHPPGKAGGKLEETKPRPCGFLRPLGVTECGSERVVRLPGRAIQKEGVERATAAEADPPFTRA